MKLSRLVASRHALRLSLWLTVAVAGCVSGSGGGSSGTGGSSNGSGGNGSGSGGSGSGGHVAGTGGTSGSGGMTGTGGVTTGTGGSGGADAGAGGSTTGSGGGGGTGGSSGAGGTAGAGLGGGGGTLTTCMSGAPTPAAGGANFPFPQHRASSSCIYPVTCADSDASGGWAKYKTNFIVDGGGSGGSSGSLKVLGGQSNTSTVSEGIAYGMLFAVYMNDKTTFDKLWLYVNAHLDKTGLMNWYINADSSTNGMNSATDSDEDMGFALVMADAQWGGYTTVAKSFLALVLANDFETDWSIKGGDQYKNAIDPSYLAPAYYKVFATYTGDSNWSLVVTRTYAILTAAANATTGLVPDWVSGRSAPNYTYDATRTPFRVALDACWFGDTRAETFSTNIAAFFATIGAANIKDGYNLNGTAIGTNHNTAFVGPAGVAAMAGNQSKLLQDAYTYTAGVATAGADNYFNSSWALFSVMMMTGNFINFTSP